MCIFNDVLKKTTTGQKQNKSKLKINKFLLKQDKSLKSPRFCSIKIEII